LPLSLSLVAIADIYHPFLELIHVSDKPFSAGTATLGAV